MSRRPRQGDPRRAVAYLRVSTDDQRLGPEAQREQIEAWSAHQGIQVAAWAADLGVSGGAELADRPGLLEALAALKAHGAGVLVVAKRDRLARDVVVAGLIEREAARAGARVLAADGAGNGDSPSEGFMRVILDGAAAYERAIIRQRTRAALAVKKAAGQRVGSIPFGCRLAADGVHLEPEPGEQEIIRRVRELRAGGASYREIVWALDAAGARTRGGGPLALSQVARMIAREVS